MRIDSHHHLWKYSPDEYGWISEQMLVLKQDFAPEDLQRETHAAGIDRTVAVQARQTLEETRWLIKLAEENEVIRGVVGWVPLAEPGVGEILTDVVQSPWLKGVRHVVHDEPDDRFILGEAFNRGIALLREHDVVYDILIFAKHLKVSIEFVDRHPEQRFVLDHIAKPTIGEQFDAQWRTELMELAKRPNVDCKFSGVVTEVRTPEWTIDQIRPYWDVAWEAFGAKRLMFGSDWPVCLLRSGYYQWISAVEELADSLSQAEQEAFWAGNAQRAYKLS